MQIMIDIPEQVYLNAKADTLFGADILVKAIKNGIPHETVTEFADRCRECGARYGKYRKEAKRWKNKWLKSQKSGKWIPVSERLPEENKTVIASTEDGVYPETRYTKEYGWEWAYEAGTEYWVKLEKVKAWMPLPKPYKAEGSDKE